MIVGCCFGRIEASAGPAALHSMLQLCLGLLLHLSATGRRRDGDPDPANAEGHAGDVRVVVKALCALRACIEAAGLPSLKATSQWGDAAAAASTAYRLPDLVDGIRALLSLETELTDASVTGSDGDHYSPAGHTGGIDSVDAMLALLRDVRRAALGLVLRLNLLGGHWQVSSCLPEDSDASAQPLSGLGAESHEAAIDRLADDKTPSLFFCAPGGAEAHRDALASLSAGAEGQWPLALVLDPLSRILDGALLLDDTDCSRRSGERGTSDLERARSASEVKAARRLRHASDSDRDVVYCRGRRVNHITICMMFEQAAREMYCGVEELVLLTDEWRRSAKMAGSGADVITGHFDALAALGIASSPSVAGVRHCAEPGLCGVGLTVGCAGWFVCVMQ
jgi:hypothetical protein